MEPAIVPARGASVDQQPRHQPPRRNRGASPGTPVHWLLEQETHELGELHQRLRDGRYACAIGLTYHPGNDARLMDLLLAYTPILLWPQSDAGFPSERAGVRR